MNFEEVMYVANEKNPFSQLIGMKMIELNEDHSVGILPINDKLLNPHGMLHGGAYYTLADTVAGVLSRTDNKKGVTLEGKMNFIKGACSGTTIKAIAKFLHKGKKTGVITVMIYDEAENVLATGIYTMFFID
ncbi:MAG: PaaI family thioesterase [Fusobacteriaceae bacterium]|nr:PaaI family thioesterase [Fusobacteriaceae bacterium]